MVSRDESVKYASDRDERMRVEFPRSELVGFGGCRAFSYYTDKLGRGTGSALKSHCGD